MHTSITDPKERIRAFLNNTPVSENRNTSIYVIPPPLEERVHWPRPEATREGLEESDWLPGGRRGLYLCLGEVGPFGRMVWEEFAMVDTLSAEVREDTGVYLLRLRRYKEQAEGARSSTDASRGSLAVQVADSPQSPEPVEEYDPVMPQVEPSLVLTPPPSPIMNATVAEFLRAPEPIPPPLLAAPEGLNAQQRSELEGLSVELRQCNNGPVIIDITGEDHLIDDLEVVINGMEDC